MRREDQDSSRSPAPKSPIPQPEQCPPPGPGDADSSPRIRALEARVRALQDELERAQENYRALFDHAPVGKYLAGADGVLRRVNRAFASMLGYSVEELEGREILSLVHPENRDGAQAAAARLLSGEVEHEALESLYLHRGGHEVLALATTRLHRSGEGDEEVFLSYVLDLTSRREVELRDRRIVDGAPLPMCFVNARGEIVYRNERFLETFGYDQVAVPDLEHWWQRAYPDPEYRAWVIATWDAAVAEAAAQGTDIAPIEYRVTRADGEERIVEISGVTLGEDFLATFVDHTDRQRQERLRALRLRLHEFSREHCLQEVLEYALDEFCETTRSPIGFFHFVTRDERSILLQAWSSRTRDEFCHLPGEALHYPLEDAGVWADAVRRRQPMIHNDYRSLPGRKGLPEGHAPISRELVVPVLRSGRVVAVVGVGNRSDPYTQADLEEFSYLVDMAFDLVEARRHFEELTRVYQAVECSRDGVGMSDAKGEHFYQNRALDALLGYDLEGLRELGAQGVYADPEVARAVFETIQAGERWAGEVEMVSRQGESLPVWLEAYAVLGEGGEVLALIGIHHDLREEKQRQAQLDAAHAELLRSNRELEQFAYVASHDLQEPLRMVASYTQLLARRYQGKLDEKADRYIQYAVDGATRMQGLINDLLDFSRIGTRGQPPAPVDCQELLEEVRDDLDAALAESGGSLEVGSLPEVSADRTQLRQVFQNLVGNALKFRGEDPPRVRVEARSRDDGWEFSVTDDGPGIEERFQERIFQVFQRLHERGRYPGSGIGLAIVKKIVERHGGTVGVESQVGRGARFWFTLPGEVCS